MTPHSRNVQIYKNAKEVCEFMDRHTRHPGSKPLNGHQQAWLGKLLTEMQNHVTSNDPVAVDFEAMPQHELECFVTGAIN